MSMNSDWTARVDQMTAGTIHEQMRTVIGEAHEVLERFKTASWEQSGLLLDAQRELEASLNEKVTKISTDVEAALAAVRENTAAIARLEEVVATAFARMRDEQTPPGLAVAG
jgi:hypothetical protein